MMRKISIVLGLLLFFVSGVFGCTPTVSHIKAKFLSGRIVDEGGGAIPDQRLVIYKNADYREIVAETRSDAKGRFWFENVPPGKYLLFANIEHSTVKIISVLKVIRTTKRKPDSEIVITSRQECDGLVEWRN